MSLEKLVSRIGSGGYVFRFNGRKWFACSDENWEIVVVDTAADVLPSVGYRGRRRIDGVPCDVYRNGDHFLAVRADNDGRSDQFRAGRES